MAVTALTPGSTSRGTTGQALLSWSVLGAPASDVVVEVVQDDDHGAPAAAVQRTGVAQLLIAAFPRAVAVIVRTAAGGVFADGAQITGEVGLRSGATEIEQYLLPQADISGTSQSLLLRLVPVATGLELSVPVDVVVAPPDQAGHRPGADGALPSVDQHLADGDLVQRSAYATRRVMGLARVPVAARRELHLAVDRSASLLPFVRSGAAQALLEVVLGVNIVCGQREDVVVWELGPAPRKARPPLGPGTVGDYWQRVLGTRPTTAGTALAPLVRETNDSGVARTVVVLTDAVPADLEELDDVLEQVSRSGTRSRWHLLVLGRGQDDPRVRVEPWRNELASLSSLVRRGLLSVTSIAPGRGDGWLDERLLDPEMLQGLVGSLTSSQAVA